MEYQQERDKYIQQILSNEQISYEDFKIIWSEATYNSNSSNLSLVVKALDKINFRAKSDIFAPRWSKSFLLDSSFLPFVQKFEQKILVPIISFPKEPSSQSLLMSNIFGISSEGCYVMLNKENSDTDSNRMAEYSQKIHDDLLDFLVDLSSGTPTQVMLSLKTIDELFNVYPEMRNVLTSYIRIDKDSSFADLALALFNLEENKLDYMLNLENIITKYKLHGELDSTLGKISNDVSRRPKL